MATQAHKLEISADPDAELVAAAQQGDLHAFDILVRRHESRIYRLAERITGNAQDAEDVLQEAFLNAYRKLYQFHAESHFYTWLVRITVNQGLMRLRRQKRRSMVSITGDTESGATAPLELRDWRSDPEQQFAAEEMAAVLNRGIRHRACRLSPHPKTRSFAVEIAGSSCDWLLLTIFPGMRC